MRVSLATFSVICLEFLCFKGLAQSIQCKENEEFQECAAGCPLTCQNYREPYFCTDHCKTGCFCRSGYVKGPDDKCIRPTECPIGPCKDGELASSCINPCNNCIQKGKCYFEYCIKGCDCKAGYYRNSTGICVLAENCGSETHLCPPNEHYTDCVHPCNDCWNKGHCLKGECQHGCDCIPGYFRDDYGTCVPEDHCENHDDGCGKNEIFTDCVNSCNDCEHQGHCDHYDCQYGCDCKRGYFRNHTGHCIAEIECSSMMCGRNEEYRDCGSACPASCSNQNPTCKEVCVRGCFCKQGYIRDPYGICVLPSNCPLVCGHYEEYSDCGSACPISCNNYNKQVPCNLHCVKGCFCIRGYIRGPGGKCIKSDECPRVCKEYEEYNECGTSCPLHCSNITSSSTLCPTICVKGCFCKTGYVRGPNGDCILQSACPPICGEYEEFKECGPGCKVTCENRAHSGDCTLPCTRGCFCTSGYIRGPNGKCILPEACPLVCDENEIFMSCGPSCEPSCSAIHRNPALCPGCQKGCFCKPGYVRGLDRKCILPTSCPTVCPENETYRLCGTSCPITCNNMGRSVSCKLHCIKGCFCNDGYVRGPNNICIKPEMCPMRCGQNEVLKECGTACQPTCDNYLNPGPCTPSCVKGCFCRRGYVRNAKGKCILTKHCPARCNNNEVLTCSRKSCEGSCDDDEGYLSRPCIGECSNGCYCRRGFVRAPEGNCVPKRSCPRIAGFDGRKKDGGEENDTVTLSSIPDEAKSTLATKSNLDLSTKLDVTMPILGVSLPVVGTLLDDIVSTPANTKQASMSSISTLEFIQKTITEESLKATEKQTVATITLSPLNSSEIPKIVFTTESKRQFSKAPMMAEEPIVSQASVQSSSPSKPTELADTSDTTKLESSTSVMNEDSVSTSPTNITTV